MHISYEIIHCLLATGHEGTIKTLYSCSIYLKGSLKVHICTLKVGREPE